MRGSFATIILAGGRGSRMGSSDRHKVCFEALGVPVIIRALETYNLCGSALNIVVVGMRAESVMETVSARFPETAFAYQREPLGTGDAARQGARLLEALSFDRDVLVVAGDKIIEPGVIRGMLAQHRRDRADATLAVIPRPPHSSAGLVVTSARGRILGIVETWDLRRLHVLKAVSGQLAGKGTVPPARLEALIRRHIPPARAAALLAPLWDLVRKRKRLDRASFETLYRDEERAGRMTVGSESIPADALAGRFPLQNLSTYFFKAGALYSGLAGLPRAAHGGEEYLTDIIGVLACAPRPAKVRGYRVSDPRDLMAFNDPRELMELEAALAERAARREAPPAPNGRVRLARPREWLAGFEQPSPRAQTQFTSWYGRDGVPLDQYRELMQAFLRRFGDSEPVAVVRSPGRINLMGRHIDHQGGSVNVMAINREILVAAAPRRDDRVTVANVDSKAFQEHTFRIADEVARLDWDDWLHTIDGPRLQRILETARGEWVNYIKAALLRLQEQFRDRSLRGMDMMVRGGIPMGAGLSSSSALVVAAAELTAAFNGLPVTARRLVSLCGEGEWFVGTRGGAADHAAIRLSRRGYVTRVGFYPFRLESAAPFFGDQRLVVCESGIYAGKSTQARHRFNEKVTCYHLGRVLFKMMRPDLAPRIAHLRDVEAGRLGLSPAELHALLGRLPRALSRREAEERLTTLSREEREPVERLFATHDPPPQGYDVRGVVLFGLAEIARAHACLDILRGGRAADLGRWMRLSHDGDRVAVKGARGRYRALTPAERAQRVSVAHDSLAEIPGAYGCSLPELDRIADILSEQPGVSGAQMAGAGLGGCVMALVHQDRADEVTAHMRTRGFDAHIFRPIAGACALRPV